MVPLIVPPAPVTTREVEETVAPGSLYGGVVAVINTFAAVIPPDRRIFDEGPRFIWPCVSNTTDALFGPLIVSVPSEPTVILGALSTLRPEPTVRVCFLPGAMLTTTGV